MQALSSSAYLVVLMALGFAPGGLPLAGAAQSSSESSSQPSAHSSTHAHAAPYAGQQERRIKSLSASDIEQLQRGGGWGLAKAAELNGMPGPIHLLELRAELAVMTARRNGWDDAGLQFSTNADSGLHRPARVVLDSSRADALGLAV